ncbi:putative ATP-binding component of a transport system [Caballeronia sordidicola]|uniref:Putative ATP-binding component of a transport system n=2 Tax=Burkholderiales TaxID=80840 RepID=A0A242N7M9_CABSO|nr:putative ATP-binding component of a transport system [Caballeronia sordidicola]
MAGAAGAAIAVWANASAACAGAVAAYPTIASSASVARGVQFTLSLSMPNNIEPVIEVRGLSKRVKDATGELIILDQIDLSIEKGSSVAIVGASGSGKSTLLGLLAGLDSASSGSVRLLGRDLGALNEDERAALRSGSVGFVFQSFQLMPHLTALENVMLPLELRGGVPHKDITSRARDLLEQVGLGQRTAHYPKLLSGGEQQRVALARAFVTHPAILFADEPTGSLDAATGYAIIDLMFEMNRRNGATLILVTHDTELAERCDATVTIEAGRIVNSLSV